MENAKERIIFHIDVNSAYLSWEAVYRLQHGEKIDLRELPAVVGGDPKTRQGIVLAKSIPAKKYGVQTGESLYSALKKCPNLIIIPPSYALYIQCSKAMLELLQEYSPCIQRFSVDEVFLDYTDLEPVFGDAQGAAYGIKERIKRELGFTVSIGISSNKLLAKIASDLKKPDAVATLFPKEIPEKMWPLPVEELFMVGRATSPKLKKLGIYTIGDLANYDLEHIKYRLKSHGEMIWKYANGIENSTVRSGNDLGVKGIGNSTTISFDVDDREIAYRVLLSLTETVAMRLRDGGYLCNVVSVGIKTNEFKYYSHQRKLFSPTDCTHILYSHVKELFAEAWQKEPIRHLSVHVTELCTDEFFQRSFFDEKDLDKRRALDRAIDKIRLSYGSKAIQRGCFLHSGVKPMTGGVGAEDFPVMSSIL